jgi:hypothetical protein
LLLALPNIRRCAVRDTVQNRFHVPRYTESFMELKDWQGAPPSFLRSVRSTTYAQGYERSSELSNSGKGRPCQRRAPAKGETVRSLQVANGYTGGPSSTPVGQKIS